MQWLTALLAFAVTMLIFAIIVSTFVEMIHRVMRHRSAGMKLMLENPRYVSAGYRRWLTDIQQLGTPLAALTSAIATSDTPNGTRSTLLNDLVRARESAAFASTATPACRRSHRSPASSSIRALARWRWRRKAMRWSWRFRPPAPT